MINMKKSERKQPFPYPSPERVAELNRLVANGCTKKLARTLINAANRIARATPAKGERCGAKTRKGVPCIAKARANGRCTIHGGMSTGPRTPEGRSRALSNLLCYKKT